MNNKSNLLLKEIITKIKAKELRYNDNIIISKNSSQVQENLKLGSEDENFEYIKQNIDKDNYYFIDSENRSFYGKKDIKSFYIHEFCLKKVIKSFLGINIAIKTKIDGLGDKVYNLHINNKLVNISKEYQAIIKIFLGVFNIQYFVKKNIIKNPIVVIQEINKNLSLKYERKILPFLKKNFPDLNFLVITNSFEVITHCYRFNFIVLKDDKYEILNTNNYNSNYNIIKALEENGIYDHKNLNKNLKLLFTQKVENTWTKKSQKTFNKLLKNETHLSNSERILLNKIKNY